MQRKSPIALDDCGLAKAINIMGDKWSLLILREVLYGVIRFADIQKELGIPKSILSQRLKKLVANNLLEKHSYKEGKSRTRYAYAPTKAGKELILPLFALMQWGDKFYREDKAPLTIIDPDTAEKLTVKLSTSDGKEVPLDKIKIIIN